PLVADQPQVGLVDQGGWLKGLTRIFSPQSGCSELTQLAVDERKQFSGGAGVAGLNGCQHLRDIGHAASIGRRTIARDPKRGRAVSGSRELSMTRFKAVECVELASMWVICE